MWPASHYRRVADLGGWAGIAVIWAGAHLKSLPLAAAGLAVSGISSALMHAVNGFSIWAEQVQKAVQEQHELQGQILARNTALTEAVRQAQEVAERNKEVLGLAKMIVTGRG